jgi:micrococcal nuclease
MTLPGMPRSPSLVFLALLNAVPLVAQTSPTQVPAAWATASNAGDAAALAALYADDPGVVTVGSGRLRRGPAAVREEMADVVQRARGQRLTIDSVQSDPLDATRALLSARWHVRTAPPDPRTVHGVVTMVLVRRSPGAPWRILQDHWSVTPEGPVAMPALATAALPDSGPAPSAGERLACRVTKVVDGDTIECAEVGRVRLIGIDTPERGQAPFGAQATRALKEMLQGGRRIELETDVELRDRYKRLLAYVWVDGRMANWLLARSGWAQQSTFPPNVRYVERFGEAVTAARAEQRGIWAVGGFACEPQDHRRGKC